MSSNQTLLITSIKPTAGHFAVKNFKSKEGEEKKPSLYVSFEMPSEFASLLNSDLQAFCMRSYSEAMTVALDNACKDNKESMQALSLAECFVAAKKEYTVTRKDIKEWLDTFAYAIINAALAAKAGLHVDSPKVVKKANKYSELLLELSARGKPMDQESIDSCLRVMEVIDKSGLKNDYTDNVLQGIVKMQNKLDAFLASGQQDEEDDDLDF